MLLSWNPIQQCLASTGVPFSVPVGWVLCYMYSVLSLQVVSSLSGPRPLILARIWGFSWAFNACALTPLCLPQASICRADVSQVGASPLGLRPLQLIFLSVRFSRIHGTFAGLAYRLGSSVAVRRQTHIVRQCSLQLCAGALL